MNYMKRLAPFVLLLAIGFSAFAEAVEAKGNEYDAICDHLEQRYAAKKVKIPFMWLARFAVAVVKPAGVKAFKITRYRDLKFSPDTLNEEMMLTMKNAFSEEWSPILRIRSNIGEQIFMNMRESGKNLKIILVTINRDEAVVVRASFNPEKLVEFVENPQIFGISFGGGGGDSHAFQSAEKVTIVDQKEEN